MLKNVTITLEDIKAYQPTAELDGVRFEPYILRVQDLDLRPVLGDVLYYDFMSKFLTPADASYTIYQFLLNGGTWSYNSDDIYFDGLKPYIICKTLARFVTDQPLNITRFGVVTKLVNQSQPADPQIIRNFVAGMNSDAQTYQNQICLYLNNNTTTFSKFKGDRTNSTTGFKMFNGSYNRSY